MADEQTNSTPAAGAAPAADGPSLIDQLLATSNVKPGDAAYAVTKEGLQSFVASLLEPAYATDRVTAALADEMIADLDKKSWRNRDGSTTVLSANQSTSSHF